jgi:2-phosphosulfolactate phosphatase
MRVDVVLLPSELMPNQLDGRVVVVFDVLRATTTITAALEAGVEQILVFGDIESVRRAKPGFPGALSCGEQYCLKPEGFDLGNSPGDLGAAHHGKTLLMSTTNGTKAILAARGASKIYTGALVNTHAVAERLKQASMPVTLLCAGLKGSLALEDVLGAGSVIESLGEGVELESDEAITARHLFQTMRDQLPRVLRETAGGRNIIRSGLEKDIDFAARMDVMKAVGEVKQGEPIRIVRAT